MAPLVNPTCLIEVGKITAPHGVKGQCKLVSYTEYPEDIATFSGLYNTDGTQRYRINIHGQQKHQWIISIEGCTTREAAESYRNISLYADQTEFPDIDEEDTYYLKDLETLEVRHPDGTVAGTIKAIHNFGAGNILEIQPPSGSSFMVAFTKDTIPTVSVADGYVVYNAPEIL